MTMRKIISGVLESVSSGFSGVVGFLISYTSGKFHASTSQGGSYSEVNPLVFGSSNINNIEYAQDLSTGITTSNYGIGTTWTPQTTPGGNFYSAAYGNNLWVIVGPNGVTTSTNRVSWSAMNSTNTFLFVSYGNGLWVAGTYSGTLPQANQQRRIQYSTDAVTWVTSNAFFGVTDINDAAFGNSLWVAIGLSGQIRYSTNAISWATSTFGTTRHLRSVAYGNGLWAAVGDYGIIGRSTDAINWVSQVSNYGTSSIRSVAYGNGIWVIAGYAPQQIRRSTDVVTWTTSNSLMQSNFGFNTVGFHSTQFLVAGPASNFGDGSSGRGSGRMSTDGITWTTNQDLSFFNNASTKVNEVVSDGAGRLLAVGYDGGVPNGKATTADGSLVSSVTVYPNNIFLAAGDSGRVASSTNGLSWNTLTSNIATNLNTINYGGKNTSSLTGIVWITRGIPFGTNTTRNLRSIAYANGLWVIGGTFFIRTSTNGISWLTQTLHFNGEVWSIAYGANVWVAAGYNGRISTSTNALSWTTRTSNFAASAIRSLAYGNNVWVAVGYGGQIRSSTNAITWVTRTSNVGSNIIYSVAYANGLWVAGGQSNVILTSTDVLTWTTRVSNFTSNFIYTVTNGNNLWVAGAYTGQLRSSTNGISWATITSNFGNTAIYSVAYANDLWVAGGGVAQIRYSTNAVTWVTAISNFISSAAISTVSYGNGLWIIAGYSSIYRTSPLPNTSNSISYMIGGI